MNRSDVVQTWMMIQPLWLHCSQAVRLPGKCHGVIAGPRSMLFRDLVAQKKGPKRQRCKYVCNGSDSETRAPPEAASLVNEGDVDLNAARTEISVGPIGDCHR